VDMDMKSAIVNEYLGAFSQNVASVAEKICVQLAVWEREMLEGVEMELERRYAYLKRVLEVKNEFTPDMQHFMVSFGRIHGSVMHMVSRITSPDIEVVPVPEDQPGAIILKSEHATLACAHIGERKVWM